MRCALKARRHEIVPIGRDLWTRPAELSSTLQGVDAVVHLAGVNRAAEAAAFDYNIWIAHRLTEALDRAETPVPVVVYANSIQSGNPSPFGRTKQAAADHLREWGRKAGVGVVDVRLPNLFGEHGRPNYNSVVATFCYMLAGGGEPQIEVDRELPLLHVQDAIDQMLELLDRSADPICEPRGTPMTVSALLMKLRGFHDLYKTGEIPDISDRLDRALFNTYRSFCFPDSYPIHPPMRTDDRGALFESVRSQGGRSQVFNSSTRPGVTRGNHFHRRKFERFVVLQGDAVISLRRLFHDAVVRFEVSGLKPALVDMPTMWTHAITNIGAGDLTTQFWTDEKFDPSEPDTFPETVEGTVGDS